MSLRWIEVKGREEIVGAWEQALSADRPVAIDVHGDASVSLLPPFPQGAKKRETMRRARARARALAQEGEAGVRHLRLLNEDAAQETKLFGH